VASDALPFSIGHLHPGISPALVGINRLPILVRPFACPVSGRDGRVPEYRYLYEKLSFTVVSRVYLLSRAQASLGIAVFPSGAELKEVPSWDH
jgi:hypothetical protein